MHTWIDKGLLVLDYLQHGEQEEEKSLLKKLNTDLRATTRFRQLMTRCKLGRVFEMHSNAFNDMMSFMADINAIEKEVRAYLERDLAITERWYKLTEPGRHILYAEKGGLYSPSDYFGHSASQ